MREFQKVSLDAYKNKNKLLVIVALLTRTLQAIYVVL